VVVKDDFPTNTHHGWKFTAFGPDGKLYIPVGAPCNICENKDPFAAIGRMNPDGTGYETIARGVRNTVGFDWHPQTKELWFTDNGRDWLGDDLPPDELNRAASDNLNFGYPYCYGHNVPDPKYDKPKAFCRNFVAPAQLLGPHVAALGMRFYTGKMFPEKYRNQIFLAEHGSWNRSRKIGYQVSLVTLKGNKALSYEPFAKGWLQGQSNWGRPVDVQVMPDGALLVSDDQAGVIYRISYDSTTSKF
jgi:glucose/arabinose dehydrogenase